MGKENRCCRLLRTAREEVGLEDFDSDHTTWSGWLLVALTLQWGLQDSRIKFELESGSHKLLLTKSSG